MHKKYYLLFSTLLSFSFSDSLAAKDNTDALSSIHVYTDTVGGPYVDEWYVHGNLARLTDLTLTRGGKSGELEVAIKVTCEPQSVSIGEFGMLWGETRLPKEEIQGYFPADLTTSITQRVCEKGTNTH